MRSIGHSFRDDHRSHFCVFGPGHENVAVVLLPDERRMAMAPDTVGYWQLELDRLPVGTRYWIDIDGERYPDIASRAQPEGVHGPSMVVETEPVSSPGWRGVPIEDAIIYELHVGTFTPEGSFAAAAERLAGLAALGITVIELMPIAAFPGHRNWGYDGVYLFAVQADYGSHAELKAFIEAAHRLGMAVLLDVVYNHFGPEGNYSARYGPFTRQASTPWGAAINFDDAWNHGVRNFYLANTRYWLEEIGFDGFRMDAVHAVFDTMPVHILRQITDMARSIAAAQGRHILMIAEHLRNDWHVTSPLGFHFEAQWNDDLNHALFACLTGERDRHLANFGSFADVVKALADGFVLDGSRFDHYRRFMTGTDARDTRGAEHIVHVQNHDQIGNRLHGDRVIATYGRAKALLAVTAMMASAFVPMIFMGEEFGATTPFLFFEDFGDADLVDGVRQGRRREFGLDGGTEPPDPHAVETFAASKLRWEEAQTPRGAAVLAYYRRLIALKRSGELGPRDRRQLRVSGDEASRLIRIETPATLTLLNFSDAALPLLPSITAGGWAPLLWSLPPDAGDEDGTAAAAGEAPSLPAFGAAIFQRQPAGPGRPTVSAR